MAWITPTTDTIKARISGAEFDALKSAALAAGQNANTLVTECLTRIVQLIRGYVGRRYPLGEAGTIPDELTSALGSLWVYEFLTRVPGADKLLNERRVKAYDDANRQLRDVSAGTFVIVPPVTEAPEAEQAGGPGITLASYSERQNTTAHLDGLL